MNNLIVHCLIPIFGETFVVSVAVHISICSTVVREDKKNSFKFPVFVERCFVSQYIAYFSEGSNRMFSRYFLGPFDL